MSKQIRDEFLSEEDRDIGNLSDEERDAYWALWLKQAQATNERDKHLYSHGVFTFEPAPEGGATAVSNSNDR